MTEDVKIIKFALRKNSQFVDKKSEVRGKCWIGKIGSYEVNLEIADLENLFDVSLFSDHGNFVGKLNLRIADNRKNRNFRKLSLINRSHEFEKKFFGKRSHMKSFKTINEVKFTKKNWINFLKGKIFVNKFKKLIHQPSTNSIKSDLSKDSNVDLSLENIIANLLEELDQEKKKINNQKRDIKRIQKMHKLQELEIEQALKQYQQELRSKKIINKIRRYRKRWKEVNCPRRQRQRPSGRFGENEKKERNFW